MLPSYCPACKAELHVKSLKCNNCLTEVSGLYDLPVILLLSEEEQNFILKFVKKSGSLKDMAAGMNLSYPTVRNILNDIIEKIDTLEKENASNK